MTWSIIHADEGPHVVPDEDLREHEFHIGCWCRPVEDDTVFVHTSLDQRERYERGELLPH